MAVKLLDKDEWTKDGRKWIFYDYVKNLDGTINVKSELGQGSEFIITIPKKNFLK